LPASTRTAPTDVPALAHGSTSQPVRRDRARLDGLAERVSDKLAEEVALHEKAGAPLNEPTDLVEFPVGLLQQLERLAVAASELDAVAAGHDKRASEIIGPDHPDTDETKREAERVEQIRARVFFRGTGVRDALEHLAKAVAPDQSR
jgi:hypothetical protein